MEIDMREKGIVFNYIKFLLGILFALGFLTLLKFTSPKDNIFAFLGSLIGMHVGIVFFVLSKKSFRKAGIDIRRYYKEVLFYLLLFIPLLIYKFVISNIWKNLAAPTEIYNTIIFTLATVCLILCVRAAIQLARAISRGDLKTDEPYSPKPNIFQRLFSKKKKADTETKNNKK